MEKKETLKHIFKLLLLTVINIGLFFAAAGTFSDMRGNIYVSIYFISTVISNALLFFCNQNSFIERGKKRENTKKWDKFLLPVILLLTGCVIFFIAGLGIRFDWGKLPIECFYAGKYLLFTVSPNNRFTQKFKSLLAEYPTVDIRAMGFPADWENEPLWKA